MTINVIGAGLAGCEVAYQLAKRKIKVNLYDMKPTQKSPAHKSDSFCELVCSNSLRSNDILNASGLLKYEMKMLGSLIIQTAEETSVPAGGALAVDRELFSQAITKKIRENEYINIIEQEVSEIPNDGITVVATGPLTSSSLLSGLKKIIGTEYLSFFDAAAPIVSGDSIDYDKTFSSSRYGKGDSDYINCPLTKDEYFEFYNELVKAECVEVKDFENNVFEGCMPVEVMAKRGIETLRFGMMKPVGLIDEKTGLKPYAVVQLRKENVENTMYNLVGFQTHLKFGEQKRVFSLIPALKNAEFLRYGVMHKNTFICSPALLNNSYQMKSNPNIFFSGQITGVEGYVESASSGLVVAINIARILQGKPLIDFTNKTVIGSLANYASCQNPDDFQPMKSNFGILAPVENIKSKKDKKQAMVDRSISIMSDIINEID